MKLLKYKPRFYWESYTDLLRYKRGEHLNILAFCTLPQNRKLWDDDDFTKLRELYEEYELRFKKVKGE